ncbi:hypothetical protein BO70DRAFT_359668 [Aspergillus heteromorphus CBS 117.55]|uniref:Uncharacterized protein n=1 Tax=Aspergillus heteromorphus CBS 117.55 TaxID=1448321 RepID=A0A317WQ67_9EURO|nr:uncharacterized protein BO70DRAFT_359668 [Aspergillus heteromorphus CBS 117.55]PWY88195.1 hypothetical protein BO70DRAFT_359668 [Aspergillus heteromorphus CBS 117.55]
MPRAETYWKGNCDKARPGMHSARGLMREIDPNQNSRHDAKVETSTVVVPPASGNFKRRHEPHTVRSADLNFSVRYI